MTSQYVGINFRMIWGPCNGVAQKPKHGQVGLALRGHLGWHGHVELKGLFPYCMTIESVGDTISQMIPLPHHISYPICGHSCGSHIEFIDRIGIHKTRREKTSSIPGDSPRTNWLLTNERSSGGGESAALDILD